MLAAFSVIILGGVVIFNPFESQDTQMFFTGISMLIDGVADLATVFYIHKIVGSMKGETVKVEEK